MSTFGKTTIGTTGIPIQVSCDGCPEWKQAGITIDWSAVSAAAADTVLPDGFTQRAGTKALLFGTVLFLNAATGKYNPALAGTTLVRGETYILNETVFQLPIFGFGTIASDHPAVFDGGRAWIQRVQAAGAAAVNPPVNGQSVSTPTLASLLAALPRLSPVEA